MKPVAVITRFNLASRYRYRKLYSDVPEGHFLFLDEEYLEKRFALFEEYTFPSFERQTDKNFRWIVLFHKDTPERFKERIMKYQEKLSLFEPCFLDDEQSENFLEVIKEKLREYDRTGVITARVDNDDMIHETFVERIKREMGDATILSFVNGLQYDTRTRRCMSYNYVNNHFMCHASSPDDTGMNIYSFQHADVDRNIDSSKKKTVRTKIPMWVEIVSGTNCVNEIWSRPSKAIVPYQVKEAYPALNLKWSTRAGWAAYTAVQIPVSFFRMFRDVVSLIKLRF